MKKSIKQGIIVVLDFGLMSLASFAITVLLAKSVMPEEYSLYVLATSLIMMMLSIHNSLVAIPLTVMVPKLEGQAKKSFIGVGLFITVIIALLFLVSLILYIHHTDGQYEKTNQFNLLLSLFSFWAFFYVLREQMRFSMLADLNVKSGFIANVTGSVLILLSLFFLFFNHELTLQTLLYGLMLSTFVPSTIMLIVQNKNINFTFSGFVINAQKYWEIGKWNLMNAFLYSGSNLSIPWLILFFSDKKSVAVYGICSAFASVANPLLRGVNGYLFPKMSHGYKDEGDSELWRLTKLSMIIMLIPFTAWLLLLSIWGDELLTLFYSKDYAGYQGVLLLIVFKMTIETISTPINSALQTIEKAYVLTAVFALGLLITLTAGLKLIQVYGLIGAAILGVISSLVMAIIKFIVLRKSLSTNTTLEIGVEGNN